MATEVWMFDDEVKARNFEEGVDYRMPSNHVEWLDTMTVQLTDPPENVRTILRASKAEKLS